MNSPQLEPTMIPSPDQSGVFTFTSLPAVLNGQEVYEFSLTRQTSVGEITEDCTVPFADADGYSETTMNKAVFAHLNHRIAARETELLDESAFFAAA